MGTIIQSQTNSRYTYMYINNIGEYYNTNMYSKTMLKPIVLCNPHIFMMYTGIANVTQDILDSV